MSLTLLTPWMLAGAALVAVPIVLHLMMRQKPKHLVFPALRFLKQREQSNRRQLNLRHLLLMLLRCAAIAMLAVALARPSIKAAGVGVDQEAPVGAAIVVDTTPRMEYRHQNQTRLESAKEIAGWVLGQLPRESDVAVLDASGRGSTFSVDQQAARQRLERLITTPAAQPLGQAVGTALDLLKANNKSRKELYVFTDLSRSAWNKDAAGRLKDQIAGQDDVGVYIVDVGVAEPRNAALGELRLSSDALVKKSPLNIQTELFNFGPKSEQSVDLYVLNRSGKPQIRSQRSVPCPANSSQGINFEVEGLEDGVQQGYLKIAGEDGLAADNIRYFSVDVRPPWKILVAAQAPVEKRALFFTEAVTPSVAWFRQRGQARFQCDVVPLDQLAGKDFKGYAAVCLLDPGPQADSVWQNLAAYARQGGGVAIWLGRHASPPDAFNSTAALELLPGKLARQWRAGDSRSFFMAPRDFSHPALAYFRSLEGTMPWYAFPVWRHWQFAALEPGVNTIVPFNNGQPAVIEKVLGKGRLLVTTTPNSDFATDTDPWNVLAIDSLPVFILTNEMMLYLVGSSQEHLNYQVGQTVVVHLPEDQRGKPLLLRAPAGDSTSVSADPKDGTITITTTEQPGNYQLKSGGMPDRGFSVNLPVAATRLDRVTTEELTALLGERHFRLARNRDEIDRNLNLGRVGRELYPLLIVLVALALGLEYIVAGRFYRLPAKEPPENRAGAIAAAMVQSSLAATNAPSTPPTESSSTVPSSKPLQPAP